jgi:isopentenyl diphosphate isomerase/L-lactate dehydrogenase-like FMN-dependent dehydrogenase
MPVEIKELHIKAIVGNSKEQKDPGLRKEDIAKLKKEITKEVMDKVTRFLKQKNER